MTDLEIARECGATSYSPPPLRAVRGLSFTFDQLTAFADRIRAQQTEMDAADWLDAERYRWLRQQHWSDAPLCVVMQPREAVGIGHECPSLDLLDETIDANRSTAADAPNKERTAG